MSEPLPNSIVFLPNGKPLNVIFFWLIPITLFIVCLWQNGVSIPNATLAILLCGMFSLDTFFYKKTISIVISVEENILDYRYYNCWGQQRLVAMDLTKATVSYKYRLVNLNYRLFAKLKLRWRILLYKDSYLFNRIIIKQDDEIGYNKNQLDQIFLLISQCKNNVG